ncbi:MAG TPA: hypothetical protein PLJ21_01315, partial [Pseudobdellovibrionaceae bacterium]|nr:hypothetical protein [Pseudobdellovibrionaceae bacterium]
AIVLTGKGVHSFQEAGLIGVAMIPIEFRIDLLGLYPSYQTLFAQIAIIALFGFLFIYDRNVRPESE